MSITQLDNLVKIGKLKAEAPERHELDGLIRSGRARLKDARNESLAAESRFDLAYNAAHALALAALRWHGYRSEQRYLVFQCLEHTLGMTKEKWRVLDRAHTKRNAAEYAGDMDVDAELLSALIRVGRELDELVGKLGPSSVATRLP
jgi:hypothetical protein